MNIWLIMLAAGLLTFATRLSFILLLDRLKMPDWFRRGLRFVPVAVLSGLILPGLVLRNEALDISVHNPQLLAGLLAILVAWRTRNILPTILVGMAALFIFEALLGFF